MSTPEDENAESPDFSFLGGDAEESAPRFDFDVADSSVPDADGTAIQNVDVPDVGDGSQDEPKFDFEGVADRVGERLRVLLRLAAEHQAFINVDMESYEKKDLTLHIFKSVLDEPEFVKRSDVGIVIQCYLKDSGAAVEGLQVHRARRGRPVHGTQGSAGIEEQTSRTESGKYEGLLHHFAPVGARRARARLDHGHGTPRARGRCI